MDSSLALEREACPAGSFARANHARFFRPRRAGGAGAVPSL